MHWTVQEAITTNPLLWVAGAAGLGGTTLENRDGRPAAMPAMEAWFWKLGAAG